MVFPIRTDRRLQHTPWVNYALITANVFIFLLSPNLAQQQQLSKYILDPSQPQLHQFITYCFLHAGFMHLAGNMLFLFVFGNNVEDRLGKIGYLGFYLAGGVLAGAGHAMFQQAPVLGASGAVAAVSGAFLALFPMSRVTVLYWFFFMIGTFEVSGLVLLLLYFAYDVLQFLAKGGGVAYLAHLSGYLFGFVVGMGLLLLRLLPREPYDMLALLERRRRRAQFESITRQGYRPWQYAKPGDPPPASAEPPPPSSAHEMQVMEQRRRISEQAAQHDLPGAAATYVRLLEADSSQVLSRELQLAIGNQLMSEGRHDPAARAYELYLSTYRNEPQREQVELILGLAYVRYLDRRQRGRELLTSALTRLHDAHQIELARQTLAQIES